MTMGDDYDQELKRELESSRASERIAALHAAAATGEPSLLDTLASALEDENRRVREAACDAIEMVGGSCALELLISDSASGRVRENGAMSRPLIRAQCLQPGDVTMPKTARRAPASMYRFCLLLAVSLGVYLMIAATCPSEGVAQEPPEEASVEEHGDEEPDSGRVSIHADLLGLGIGGSINGCARSARPNSVDRTMVTVYTAINLQP